MNRQTKAEVIEGNPITARISDADKVTLLLHISTYGSRRVCCCSIVKKVGELIAFGTLRKVKNHWEFVE